MSLHMHTEYTCYDSGKQPFPTISDTALAGSREAQAARRYCVCCNLLAGRLGQTRQPMHGTQASSTWLPSIASVDEP